MNIFAWNITFNVRQNIPVTFKWYKFIFCLKLMATTWGKCYSLHDNSYTPLSITAEILPSEVNQQPINLQPINNLFKYSIDIITKMHFFRACKGSKKQKISVDEFGTLLLL